MLQFELSRGILQSSILHQICIYKYTILTLPDVNKRFLQCPTEATLQNPPQIMATCHSGALRAFTCVVSLRVSKKRTSPGDVSAIKEPNLTFSIQSISEVSKRPLTDRRAGRRVHVHGFLCRPEHVLVELRGRNVTGEGSRRRAKVRDFICG